MRPPDYWYETSRLNEDIRTVRAEMNRSSSKWFNDFQSLSKRIDELEGKVVKVLVKLESMEKK